MQRRKRIGGGWFWVVLLFGVVGPVIGVGSATKDLVFWVMFPLFVGGSLLIIWRMWVHDQRDARARIG